MKLLITLWICCMTLIITEGQVPSIGLCLDIPVVADFDSEQVITMNHSYRINNIIIMVNCSTWDCGTKQKNIPSFSKLVENASQLLMALPRMAM